MFIKSLVWDFANRFVLYYLKFFRPALSQEERYRVYMKVRVFLNPELAIGQPEKSAEIKVGESQFVYLKMNGLRPEHRLLDYGCGALRAGRYFIPYLDTGNYFGVDISQEVLQYSQNYLKKKRLLDRNPTLRYLESSEVPFDQKFDFIIAQSVFTHTDLDTTSHIIMKISESMHDSSKFFATFWLRDSAGQFMGVDYYYTRNIVESMAKIAGLQCLFKDDYIHPSQQMVLFYKTEH